MKRLDLKTEGDLGGVTSAVEYESPDGFLVYYDDHLAEANQLAANLEAEQLRRAIFTGKLLAALGVEMEGAEGSSEDEILVAIRRLKAKAAGGGE